MLRAWPNSSLHSQRTAPLMAVGCRFYQHPSTLFYLHHFDLLVLVESQKPIMIYFYSLGNNGKYLTVLLLSCLPNALSLNAGLPILGKFITVATINVPRIMGVGPEYMPSLRLRLWRLTTSKCLIRPGEKG